MECGNISGCCQKGFQEKQRKSLPEQKDIEKAAEEPKMSFTTKLPAEQKTRHRHGISFYHLQLVASTFTGTLTLCDTLFGRLLAECGGRSSYSSCSSSGPTQDRCSVSRYILTSTLHSLLLPSPEISVRPWQTSFDLRQSIWSLAMLMCWNWTYCVRLLIRSCWEIHAADFDMSTSIFSSACSRAQLVRYRCVTTLHIASPWGDRQRCTLV